MNQSPMSAPFYRPNQQQQYAPMSSPAARPQRFGFHVPSPFPRPRSSASKPNPGSTYPLGEGHMFDNNPYETSHDRSFNSKDGYPYEDCIRNNSYENNSNMSEDDLSFVSCLDTSFSTRSNKSFGVIPPSPVGFSNTYIGKSDYPDNFCDNSNNCQDNYFGGSGYQNTFAENQSCNAFRNISLSTSVTPGILPKPKFKNTMQQQQPESISTGQAFGGFQTNFKKSGVKRKATAPQPIQRCELCNLDFTSQIPLDMHLRGTKHMKKIKALETLKTLQAQGHAKENDTVTNAFRCEACEVTLNGALQLQTHFDGAKHKNKFKELKTKLDCPLDAIEASKHNGADLPMIVTSVPEPVTETVEQKSAKMARFCCDTCNITVNSQIQLLQHLGSKKHKAKLEGRPLLQKKWVKKDGEEAEVKEQEASTNVCIAGVTETVHGIPPLSSTFVHKETLN